MNPLYILLAILPGFLICYFIFKMDKYEKEPLGLLAICFFLGMAVTYPAMRIEAFGDALGLNENGNFLQLLTSSFFVVAFVEEFMKFAVLMLVAYPNKAFNEPMDGIVYAVMVGIGFATLENILYADRFGIETVIVRAFTAVPAHAVFAIFMGYFVGMAKFDKKNRYKLIAFGFLAAVLIHGVYDFFILQQYYEWLMTFATLTLFVSIFFAIRLIKKHQINSPFNSTEEINPSIKTDDEIMSEIIAQRKMEEE